MEQKYKIDEIFKDKLAEHESPVPDHLWIAIDAQRTPTHRINQVFKRKIGTISVFAALLFVGLATLLYISKNNDMFVSDPSNESFIAAQETTISINHQTEVNTITKATSNNYNPSDVSSKLENAKESSIVNQQTDAVLQNQFISSSISDPETKENIVNQLNTADNNISNSKVGEIYRTTLTNRQSTGVKQKSFDILTPIFEGPQAPLKVKGLTDLKASTSETMKNTAKAPLRLDSSLDENFDPLSPAVPLFSTHSLMFDKNEASIDESKMPNINAETDPRCARFGPIIIREKPRRYIDGFLAYGYSQKQLRVKDASNTSRKYVEDRLLTETPLGTVAAGGRYSIVFNKGLAFRTGVVYTQITERMKHVHEFYESNNQLSEWKINWLNKYRMIDVPLIVGYEFKKNNMALAINAGVNMNVLLNTRGIILAVPSYTGSDYTEPISYGIDSEFEGTDYNIFKNRIGANVVSSVGFYINATRNLQWLIEPQVMYTPTSISNLDYTLEQRYVDFSLRVGIRYDLK